jgi:hypothetical protein
VASQVEPVKELVFKNWKEFKTDLFDRIKAEQTTPFAPPDDHTSFLFRGQACSDWPLWTSFDRLMEPLQVPKQVRIEAIYEASLADFFRHGMEMGTLANLDRLSGKAFETVQADSLLINELEAFAQHYGLPTRLLDWSRSPYVAAFFAACEPEKCQSGYISVWCLDVVEARAVTNEHDLVIRDQAIDSEKRQVWQRGAFTVNRTNLTRTDHIFLLDQRKLRADPRVPVLLNCKIPVKESPAMLRDLDYMRINYLSVYPDIEGLIKDTRYRTSQRLREMGA